MEEAWRVAGVHGADIELPAVSNPRGIRGGGGRPWPHVSCLAPVRHLSWVPVALVSAAPGPPRLGSVYSTRVGIR